MAKDKLTEYSATNASNDVIGDISVAEGMLPSAVNNALREQMTHLKNFSDGTDGIDVLSLDDDDASASIKIQAPSAVTTTTTLTLPDGDGDAGAMLQTNGSGQLAWSTAYRNRNLVSNGAMNVAQRSVSVTGLGDGDEGYVTLDRVRHTAAASAGRFTSAQTAISDLPGFLNCLHLDCTTADTSIASSELLVLEYRMEGQNLQQLKKGTSSAESITVSFYMKTNKAFTFMCALNDYDNNRINTQQFTTTTDWTRHSITFVGDTTGALDDDANNSLSIELYLHAGATYTGGTYSANTWQSRASSDNMRAVGIGSFYDSTDNDIKLSGLQMEIGEIATPFEHRSFADELLACQRYAVVYNAASSGNETFVGSGTTIDNDDVLVVVSLPNNLRATPTATFTNFGVRTASASSYNNTINGIYPPVGGNTIGFNIDSADTPYTAGQAVLCVISAGSSNHLTLDSEL